MRPDDRQEVSAFVEFCQSKHSPKTVQTYREGAIQFVGYTQKRGMPLLADVRREHVEDFLGSLRERGNKPATVANRHRALRALFNWMIHEDLRREHPMERIKPPRIPSQVLPHYSDDDIGRLLKAVPDKAGDELLLRDRAMVLTLLDTGLRAQELCDVRLGDLDRKARHIHIRAGKGGKGRMVGYSYDTQNALNRYLRTRGGWPDPDGADGDQRLDQPLFAMQRAKRLRARLLTPNAIRNMMVRRFAEAGIVFKGIHAFRRAFGISFLENGGDPNDLKTLAGWSSWSMLSRYTAATETSRALRAHEEHSPVARLMRDAKR